MAPTSERTHVARPEGGAALRAVGVAAALPLLDTLGAKGVTAAQLHRHTRGDAHVLRADEARLDEVVLHPLSRGVTL